MWRNTMENTELIKALRDAESNTELDCEINELRPILLAAADALKAADKREEAQVVRCKDCCYWNRKYTTVGECEKLADRDKEGGAQFDCDMDNDDFCSYGKRKDGDSNDE